MKSIQKPIVIVGAGFAGMTFALNLKNLNPSLPILVVDSETKFIFKPSDTILFGRESAGVPEEVHKIIKNRLKIPMNSQVRSLNIASSVAIVLAESLRQIELI